MDAILNSAPNSLRFVEDLANSDPDRTDNAERLPAPLQMLSLEVSVKPCAVSRPGSEISATVKLGNVERETIIDWFGASSGVIGEI
jgi:hypothetical protein